MAGVLGAGRVGDQHPLVCALAAPHGARAARVHHQSCGSVRIRGGADVLRCLLVAAQQHDAIQRDAREPRLEAPAADLHVVGVEVDDVLGELLEVAEPRLRGVRGPRGGYRLARERRRVSVGDVVRVVRGIEDLPPQEDLASSSELGRKVIGPFWASTEQELMARLDQVTIEDLCRRAENEGVVSEAQRSVDFAI